MLSNVVCNASPVIGLAKINKLELLWELFETVYVPNAVFIEISNNNKLKNHGEAELREAIANKKIILYHVQNTSLIDQFYGRLHHGELEVIVSAKELGFRTVIIDDLSARKFAAVMLLQPLGIVGLLLLAKNIGKLTEVKSSLDLLISSGYRISNKLYESVLVSAGEIPSF